MAQAIEIEKSISVFKKMADKLALEYLKATLEEAEGQRIECYDEQGEPIGYEFCVTYDGGRHPEYDANPFSDVRPCSSRVTRFSLTPRTARNIR